MDSRRLAHEILNAERSACYAAPGILKEPAEALARLSKSLGPELITVCLDFDERVMRMGFGTLEAVKILRDAGIEVRSTSGIRTGLLIVDDSGYIFTPTALFLEADQRPSDAPNAMRLSKEQVIEALARLSPAAKTMALFLAETEGQRARLLQQAVEVPSSTVNEADFTAVQSRLEEAPPAQFDVARQVRVFDAYLQYVELNLSGAAIQRHRLAIPPGILGLGDGQVLEGRLRTTFDLIEKGSKHSSAKLEADLRHIRENFTASLGKVHGRVLLKAKKPIFEERLAAVREKLAAHQRGLAMALQRQIDTSRKQVIDHYLPQVLKKPPDALLGQLPRARPTKADAMLWLEAELDHVFPTAESLLDKMKLEVRYKDVTFETLNDKKFLELVSQAFPGIDWVNTYAEFLAAGEQQK